MKYSTHSRKEILSFFEENSSSSFSAEEVSAALPDIGKSTVYRTIALLLSQGRVRETGREGRKSIYQYSDIVHCPRHMHIKCVKCGRTEHLDEDATQAIGRVVESLLGYEAKASTVLDGVCVECRGKEK